MKHFYTFIFILILFASFKCGWITGRGEDGEKVLNLPVNEAIPPLPADGGTVNQTGLIAFIDPSVEALYLFVI